MTIDQYRKDPDNIKKAAKILANADLLEMLECVRASIPGVSTNGLPLALGMSAQDHSQLLGFKLGWEAALLHLRAMGQPMPLPLKQITETYPERTK